MAANAEISTDLPAPILGHALVKRAVCRSRPFSRQGILENLFAWSFCGLVYPQIWEDPAVDLEALAITPQCHLVAIASGGCNILSYLTADPARVTAIDLNRAHIALNRLKLAAIRNLPSWPSFYQFFGEADEPANLHAYWRYIAPHLDAQTRAYWERRTATNLGRRRIDQFSRNFYRRGLLGRFIGFGHALARAYGVRLEGVLEARTRDEQRRFFAAEIAPLFDKRLVRWATARPASLYGLGIPPAQYAALAATAGDVANLLRRRLEKLACDFGIDENYFAWQAFGRRYSEGGTGPLPPYLQRKNFERIRDRAARVEVLNCSYTEYLSTCPARSLDRYVLLDAQDWMTGEQLNALWREITRTARRGARVIFRTAAEPSLLPGRIDPALLRHWRYEIGVSRDLTARDRSAIYGGFHLYVFED